MRRLAPQSPGGRSAPLAHAAPAARAQSRPLEFAPFACALTLALTLTLTGHSPVQASESNRLLDLSARAGLVVDQTLIFGRVHTSPEHIRDALALQAGMPLLAFDVQEAQARLESLPWIKQAIVERRWPNQVVVHLVERDAIALWQDGTRFTLIDAEGVEIRALNPLPVARTLPLLVGPGAPAAAADLLRRLEDFPELRSRLKAAVRVSNRRWDIRLDAIESGGLTLRLPEGDFTAALDRLLDLDRQQGLFVRNLELIDLRYSDRLIVRPVGDTTDRPLPPTGPGRDA